MMDSRVTREVLEEAPRSGAKASFAGDDRPLAHIERGGLFTEMRQQHGAAEITEITRQRIDWQRTAARELAKGWFGNAVAAFDKAGASTPATGPRRRSYGPVSTQRRSGRRAAVPWCCPTASDVNPARSRIVGHGDVILP
jgi:hypothetical protein